MNHPKKLLKLFAEALERAKEYQKAVEWKESKWDTPELVPSNTEAPNEERLSAYKQILCFLDLAIFGVDEEGRARGARVSSYVQDNTRDQASYPFWSVYADRDSTLRELVEARECAHSNARSAQEVVDRLDGMIQRALKDIFKKEDFIARAKNCKSCKGKGWLLMSPDAYQDARRKSQVGDDFWTRTSCEFYDVPFRGIACKACQPLDAL